MIKDHSGSEREEYSFRLAVNDLLCRHTHARAHTHTHTHTHTNGMLNVITSYLVFEYHGIYNKNTDSNQMTGIYLTSKCMPFSAYVVTEKAVQTLEQIDDQKHIR